MVQLNDALSASAQKLKSTFLSIFARYGRNFDNEADEIDLSTLTIVKNNGHLFSNYPLEDFNNQLDYVEKQQSNRSTKSNHKKIIQLPRINWNILEDLSFDDALLYLLYSDFLQETDWELLERENSIECKLHLTSYSIDCFDCLLEGMF